MLLEHQILIDQVRRIAASLNDTERLALIRAIASLEPPKQEKTPGGGVSEALLDAEQQAWFARPLAVRVPAPDRPRIHSCRARRTSLQLLDRS